ncbi:MAG TPA: Wzz/FepE/Etk N-terminal domain-containing protein [Parafilimonas sp.]|jgi:uncharacterized protein involved in exopolysaccharide biosynthesis|nr:Wzz/FepE/Etk N-terminal domain-containing protein [Parafilimonas sp.]
MAENITDKDQISLKEILLTIRDWIAFLFSKWLIILIVGLIGGALGFLYAALSKPQYSASIDFILANSDENNTNLMGLASQFGINLGTTSDDAFRGNNIIALMKSRRMVQKALLMRPPGASESLLNIFCRDNKLPDSWKKDARLSKIYPFPDSLSQMSRTQDSIFREIYDGVQKDNLEISLPNKDQTIYNVTTTSRNEIFSFYLTKYVADVTSAFYIETKTSVAKSNLSMLQHEADSLRNLLGAAITASGSETDFTFNLNPAYQVQRSASQKSQMQATVLGTAYGEVVKNLELAKITLQKQTPLYQIIDEPSLPLKMETKSKLVYLLAGGFFAGIIICIWLMIRRVLSS